MSYLLDAGRTLAVGGNLTGYLTAFDQRTVAATPRCFMASYFPPISASRNL